MLIADSELVAPDAMVLKPLAVGDPMDALPLGLVPLELFPLNEEPPKPPPITPLPPPLTELVRFVSCS